MQCLDKTLMASLLLALPLALVPAGLDAQETPPPPEEMEVQCVADFAPNELRVGAAAVRLTATLSEVIGPVQDVEASPNSGLDVAAPEDLPRREMAQEEEETLPREPIELTGEGNRLTVWLNTEQATPGTHELKLKGQDGTCRAEVTVIENEKPK